MQDFIAIPSITAICYLAGEMYKAFVREDAHRHIPVFCAVVGAVLGVLCHLFAGGYIPAENLLVAVAIGAVSGWAATGVNQTVKQETSGK